MTSQNPPPLTNMRARASTPSPAKRVGKGCGFAIAGFFGLAIIIAILQEAGLIEKPPETKTAAPENRRQASPVESKYVTVVDDYFQAMTKAFEGFSGMLKSTLGADKTNSDAMIERGAALVVMRLILESQAKKIVPLTAPKRYSDFHIDLLVVHAQITGAYKRVDIDYINDRMLPAWERVTMKF